MKQLEGALNESSKRMEERNNANNETDTNEGGKIENLNEVNNAGLNVQQDNNEEKLTEESEIAEKIKQLPVVGVGDSVLLAAVDGLYRVFPNGYFDGKVSRSMIGGEEVLTDLKNKGKLGNVVILALANNSDFFEWRIDRLMNVLEDRQVYWVTAVLADDPKFNEKFRGYAREHPNIHIVEWEEKSKDHPEYFYEDGIHVKGDGIDAYANIIYEAICEDYKKGILKTN